MGEIYISNKMTSTYSLVGFRESIVDVEILVGNYTQNDIQVEIDVRAIKNSDKRVELEVKYSNQSNITVEITPVIMNTIEVEIEVNPHNKMGAYYELKEPPISLWNGTPIQDTFVIQQSPYSSINYGNNNSMIVGQDSKGDNITYVRFDFSLVEQDIMLKTAKLRLYYSQLSEEIINLYRINESWGEYGTTYNNKPEQMNLLPSEYTINHEQRYIEFTVTETVREWILGIPNNGFALKSDGLASIFRARESRYSPELNIEYYSSLPAKIGNSRKEVSITCRSSDYSTIPVELEVNTNFAFSTISVEIQVHRYTDIYTSIVPVELYVTRPNIPVEIDVVLTGTSSIPVEISCGSSMMNEKQAEIEVASYGGNKDIEVEITVQRHESSEVLVEIEAYRNYTNVNSEIEVEIISRKYISSNSTVEVEIEVTDYKGDHSDIVAEIEVPAYSGQSEIMVDIFPRLTDGNVIEVEIEAYRNYVEMNNNIEVEITVQRYDSSEIEVEIEAYRNYINLSSDITVEIGVPATATSDKVVELYVTRDNVEVDIVVPYYASNTKEVEIRARVLLVNDILVEIEVGQPEDTYSYSYVYII